MNPSLEELIERARSVRMSPRELEAQRQSFAYGNAKIENNDITREIVAQAAMDLSSGKTQTVEIPASAEIARK